MTSSLSAFINSLLWGAAVVVIPLSAALLFISQKDKIQRN
uniref:Photosystem II reaction center protein X n=1 Tax=Cyanophora sudae TaxID=1522369 RepID=A0A2Z4HG21_9EUKA|nr:photosystem II protein X [Cyanophora sudae]AWW13739.1 photosystem II protein X [Cyanophora sudae]